ncbi:MAG: DsrE family protein [Gammaproteobacteria bacterium]|jgi:sulfur relay (sulfurtransferase) complex TusBCD TusD component (DsrE family)|nr:DsrE family protein [Gammaproteobacteria bacterium]MBU0772955.1 DsrE family protein [Gammaproteobacteria bacterium]MBU0857638.1 DsrE family protein [Gammaproteobacteria bacterium]MBU1848618.1 DsrE family protein [Gammaproteobacteria bacterium]
MPYLPRLILALALVAGTFCAPARAAENAPLFLNLTSDNVHRATMGIAFARAQFERGHPLTIFLNDEAVRIGSKANTKNFVRQQRTLDELMRKGVEVLVCRDCMTHYGVREDDLIAGVKVDNSDLSGEALFRNDTRALTW